MHYFLFSLSYDGGNYHGWVIQKNNQTVQSTLNQAISKVVKSKDFKTLGASKTDSGVHALDQKVLLVCQFKPQNLQRFAQAINKALPNTLQIKKMKAVDFDFNFYDQVVNKTYRYIVNNYKWNLPTQRYEWTWLKGELNVHELQKLCDVFVGTHDFRNFCGLKPNEFERTNPVRTIETFKVQKIKNRIVFEVQGKGFLRYQIRMMIGAIFKVAQQKKYDIEDLKRLLNGKPDTKIPFLAPAQGLCLTKIVLKTKLP